MQAAAGTRAARAVDGEKFSVRYMTDGRQWRDDWPPPQTGNTGTALRSQRQRPLAVEITLQHEDWGTITRIIEVAS